MKTIIVNPQKYEINYTIRKKDFNENAMYVHQTVLGIVDGLVQLNTPPGNPWNGFDHATMDWF